MQIKNLVYPTLIKRDPLLKVSLQDVGYCILNQKYPYACSFNKRTDIHSQKTAFALTQHLECVFKVKPEQDDEP